MYVCIYGDHLSLLRRFSSSFSTVRVIKKSRLWKAEINIFCIRVTKKNVKTLEGRGMGNRVEVIMGTYTVVVALIL